MLSNHVSILQEFGLLDNHNQYRFLVELGARCGSDVFIPFELSLDDDVADAFALSIVNVHVVLHDPFDIAEVGPLDGSSHAEKI